MTPPRRPNENLSAQALRVLALFRSRGCQLAGRGLLWQVLASAAVPDETKQAGLHELTGGGFLVLEQGQRYVVTPAGETRMRQLAPTPEA